MSDATHPSPPRTMTGQRATRPPSVWPAVARLIRLGNQSGTLLLIWPALWALTLAGQGGPSPHLLLVFALGAFFMRSAGVVINDLADRRFDREVARTKTRPLASGLLTPKQAAVTLIILLGLAATLLLALNTVTILLSPVAVLLATVYPFAKRVLWLPQAVLGMAFAWGVIMAWAAQTGGLDLTAWLLYAATVFWAIGYDTIYALQDRDDDARIGVRSSALLFGPYAWLAVAVSLMLMLLSLGLAGHRSGLNLAFYGMLAAVGGFLSQQVLLLRCPLDSSTAFRLFRQHVWVGGVVLVAFWLGFL